MKITGLAEQYDTGNDVSWAQDGAHVRLAVEAISGSNEGVAMLTPSQARALADGLTVAAREAERYGRNEASL
jgi:hypothetical protein